jgi:hypothetical protein
MSLFGLFDYPKEIKRLESQIPTRDRDTFLSRYKKLSKNDKTSFKQALRSADLATANEILGEDLNQYHVTLNKPMAKANGKPHTGNKGATLPLAATNLAVGKQINEKQITPAILPAEAARRYANFSTTTRTTLNSLAAAPVPHADDFLMKAAPTAGISKLSTVVASANETNLYRIDSSGIFAIPDEISVDKIKSVLVNGKPIGYDKYAITENGNLDIFESDKDSVVSVVL